MINKYSDINKKKLFSLYDFFPESGEKKKNNETYNKYVGKKLNIQNEIFEDYINKLTKRENIEGIIKILNEKNLIVITDFLNENIQFNSKKFTKNIDTIVNSLIGNSVLINSLRNLLENLNLNDITNKIYFEDILCYKPDNIEPNIQNEDEIEAISFSIEKSNNEINILGWWSRGNNVKLELRYYKGNIDILKLSQIFITNEI